MKKMETIELIQTLSTANGVSGFEEEVVKIYKETCQEIGEMSTDGMKNLYIQRKENQGNRRIVQLDAHSDEVGLIVQAILPNGMLRFLTVGGWVANNLSAQKVRVRNRQKKYITGVVTSIPPHFLSESERKKPLSVQDLLIDVGAKSKKEVEEIYGIAIGSPIVPDVECKFDEKRGLFLGKAFDCRIGCACMADVLDELKGEELPFDVVATLSSQEEVGLRGATVAANKVKSDLAIVFEGCPADDLSKESFMIQSAMGKGPMLRHFDVSMITSPEFQEYALEVAKKLNIPVQVSVRSGGGTNGAAIQKATGSPTIVIAIPVRYAHTHHGMVEYQDYLYAKELALGILRKLSNEEITTLIQPV
ncbi:M42 family metallopeptidase [Pilibacter termitis]|uniref:M42 family metallopeptidase n=1 Tax=Pilibacter termitis TaxID=263852 RepID=UPI00190E9019|nr:M20/M25/M40 family metallo-hydrolase [Pilibacter termitis]